MIDKKLQKRLVDWLESPRDSRNIEEGATILLKINRNQIMYRNAIMNPGKYAPHIEYQLRKYYNKEVIEDTIFLDEEDEASVPEKNKKKKN